MENRITEIQEKCCVFTKSIDADFDYQENLQAYNDDILKIIRCSINNFVVNTVYQNGVITVHGKSKISITYISETNACLSCAEFEEDFEKNIPCETDEQELFADVTVCNKYCNCRIINQRRVDIHNSFQLNICAYTQVSSKMLEACENVLINKQTVSYVSRIGSAYVKSDFEDEATVSEGPVKKIINVFANVVCREVKLIDDKMLVKTQLNFSVLYTVDGEKENICRCEKSTEVSTIVDIPGIKEDDIPFVKVRLGNLFYKIKADSNNELTIIELMGDINLLCVVYRRRSIELADDCYSVTLNTESHSSQIMLNTNYELLNETENKTVSFTFDSVNISQILDLTVEFADESTLVMGAFIYDSNGELQFISDKQKCEISSCNVTQIYITSFDFVMKSEKNIELRLVISYSSLKFESKRYNILSDVDIKGECTFESPVLSLYFADKNERLWDIAKAFRTSVELIKKENEISKDFCDTKRVLLIPGI